MGVTAAVILSAIGLTLFAHWEPSQESWGYWLFARIFAETGEFIVPGRSPLYTLYLNLFRWMGYPLAVSVEYFVTSLITVVALLVLLRRYLSLPWLILAVILWIPFFQISEPPVQKLALACSCFAVAFRDINANRSRVPLSYALLVLACMFRNTYSILIVIFLIADAIYVLKQNSLKGSLQIISPKRDDWPIAVIIILLVWFGAMQSSHRWNNAQFASTQWFPGNSKSLSDAAFFQHYNGEYIRQQYGLAEDKDYYLTHQELFKGAATLKDAVLANPKFVIKQMLLNLKRALIIAVKFTLLPSVFYEKIPQGSRLWFFVHPLITLPLAFGILYGAFRACQSKMMALFLIGNLILIGTSILALPKERYMYPLIPILILSAYWWGKQLQLKISKGALSVFRQVVMPLILILFSNGLVSWGAIAAQITGDMQAKKIRVMEMRPDSMKASIKSIEPFIQNCQGVLSVEHAFFGAFTKLPLNKFYDIWEIPPFSSFGKNFDYQGLHPDRIDCVLLYARISMDTGGPTNQFVRYQNYIKPYAVWLQDKGAKVYDIKQYGQAVILCRDTN